MHRSVLALPLVLALAPPLAQTTERVAAAETTYEIAPGSEVGFEGKSTLHGFTGRTTHVSGSVRTTLSDPGALCSGRIEADAASLDTGSTGRDKDMREVLEVGAHPKIVFELDRLERAGRDAASGVITGTAAGRITIRGVTRPFTMPVRVVQEQGGRLTITGAAPLDMTAYGIKPPRVLGFIKVAPEVRVTVSLKARPQA